MENLTLSQMIIFSGVVALGFVARGSLRPRAYEATLESFLEKANVQEQAFREKTEEFHAQYTTLNESFIAFVRSFQNVSEQSANRMDASLITLRTSLDELNASANVLNTAANTISSCTNTLQDTNTLLADLIDRKTILKEININRHSNMLLNQDTTLTAVKNLEMVVQNIEPLDKSDKLHLIQRFREIGIDTPLELNSLPLNDETIPIKHFNENKESIIESLTSIKNKVDLDCVVDIENLEEFVKPILTAGLTQLELDPESANMVSELVCNCVKTFKFA